MYQNSLVQPVETTVSVNTIVKSAASILGSVAKMAVKATVVILKAPIVVLNGLMQADELEEARRRTVDTRQYANIHHF